MATPNIEIFRPSVRIIGPIDNRALCFIGFNITAFLKSFEDIIIAIGVLEAIMIKMLPAYIKA